MTTDPAATTIQSRYAQQYSRDLEANRAEQDDLTQALEKLRSDEAWLLQQLDGVPGSETTTVDAAVAPESPAPAGNQHTAGATASVSLPRQDVPAKKAMSRPAAAKAAAAQDKAAGATKKAPAKQPAVKSVTRKRVAKKTAIAGASAAQPTSAKGERKELPLRELILGILLAVPGEPRVAREITDQLAKDHPDRSTSVQTVRNTLETLVKKGSVERSTQQGSVMYTAYANGGTDVSGPSAVGEAAPVETGKKAAAVV
ncbi:hypothetical protein [Streptomyces sp. NPDC091416]|uniref:hypothetical protein n=1 Tax=Streptomyces sp. NPDC091416 TaxID=3366003 RepID=UPI00380EE8F1